MEADLRDLLTRAQAGDARAAATLGRSLLFGQAPHDGINWLREAERRGDAEAPAILAMLAVHGVLEARDMLKALDLLVLAAERGWAPAQAQLRLLARAEGEDWRVLRQSVDVAALTQAPPRRVVSERPRVRVLESFATPQECDWLIERGRHFLKRALVTQASPESRASETRTNTEADLAVQASDVVTAVLVERAAAAAHVTRPFCEIAKMLHYEPGQEFQLHGDFAETHTSALREEIARLGQRIATLLIYLNDDYEGGETEFPKLGFRHKGRKGDALLFVNVDDAGEPDYDSVHAGSAPTRGEKWVFSQWVRGKAINGFMTPGAERETLDADWIRKI